MQKDWMGGSLRNFVHKPAIEESRRIETSNYPPERSSLAVASLVAGILSWLIIPFLGAIVAIVTGHLAKRDIRESNGALTGNGMATAGLILGYVQIVLPLCAVVVIVILVLLGPSIDTIFSDIIKSI